MKIKINQQKSNEVSRESEREDYLIKEIESVNVLLWEKQEKKKRGEKIVKIVIYLLLGSVVWAIFIPVLDSWLIMVVCWSFVLGGIAREESLIRDNAIDEDIGFLKKDRDELIKALGKLRKKLS